MNLLVSSATVERASRDVDGWETHPSARLISWDAELPMSSRAPASTRTLAHLLRPAAGRWVALGVVVAIGSLLALAGPLVVRELVDRAAAGADERDLQVLAIVFLVVAVVRQVLSVITARAATSLAWTTTNEFRLDMTRHVLGLDHEFHRHHTPGELIQRVDGDITEVNTLCSSVLPRAVGSVLIVVGMVVVVLLIDWRIGISMGAYVGMAIVIIYLLRRRSIGESEDELRALAKLYGGIEERLTAAEDLRSNGAGQHAMWRFVGESAGALDTMLRRARAYLGMWWSVQGIVTGGVVLTVAGGAALVAARRDHDRHRVLALPVHAPHPAPARGDRARARDRAEGQRSDAPRRRSAPHRGHDPRRGHHLAAGGRAHGRPSIASPSTTATTYR